MAPTTRTIGPLHFEDLEPKRFEDLVRQLAYDFKPWRRLEATGRAGSDDGFDARGFEIVGAQESAVQPGDAEDDEALATGTTDRLWLVQCKRERTIGPTKLEKYLDDIVLTDGEQLHGVVFAAACDFSKKSRDKFRNKCAAMGVQDWHLWGKAEIEDKLMRPENDGLLFAYFGVSLTIRRRSQRTELRARLAMKRKAHRMLTDRTYSSVLLRSPDAVDYPGHSADGRPGPWRVMQYLGMRDRGLRFSVGKFFAYLSDDGTQFDVALAWNESALARQDPWVPEREWAEREVFLEFWSQLPEKNRAWFTYEALVDFDDVLDIDDIGDEYFDGAHVYVQFKDRSGPFRFFDGNLSRDKSSNGEATSVFDEGVKRTDVFPDKLRHDKDLFE